MAIRHVEAHEAKRLRELRLASLRADPGAFGATYESDAARAPEWWERGARLSAEGVEQRTFVVVDGEDRWLGMALARAESVDSAVLNAMWVAPEARGQGHARALCDACATWAAERGFAALDTAVVAGNAAARRTYESAGFTFVGTSTWTGHGRTLHEERLRRPLR
jgi:ribosomal protein S18 acetylase RimI-like enzyme